MTAQNPEILLHRGTRYDLCDAPLSPYLARLPRDRRPRFDVVSTSCHRGYIGIWEIRAGMLTLVGIEDPGLSWEKRPRKFISAEAAFPWLKRPLAARWYTAAARCPEGRMRSYVHMGFASKYERDRHFVFEKGVFVGEYLTLNPPPALVYRIDPDGSRRSIDPETGEDLKDPFEPGEEPCADLFWGRPPADTADVIIFPRRTTPR